MQIPHLRPAEYKRSRLPRNRRTVNRAYGGVLSGSAVRERFVHQHLRLSMSCCIHVFSGSRHVLLIGDYCRIIRAFLVEEQKIVKKVLKIQKTKEKQSSKWELGFANGLIVNLGIVVWGDLRFGFMFLNLLWIMFYFFILSTNQLSCQNFVFGTLTLFALLQIWYFHWMCNVAWLCDCPHIICFTIWEKSMLTGIECF